MLSELYETLPEVGDRGRHGGDATRTGNNLATTISATGDLFQIVRDDQDIDPFLHVLAPAMVPRST